MKTFEVTFEVSFDEDIDPQDAAIVVAHALEDAELPHSVVFVQELDENDGSRVGDWVAEDQDDEPFEES